MRIEIFDELGGSVGKMRGRKVIPPIPYFPNDLKHITIIKDGEDGETKVCMKCEIKISNMNDLKEHMTNFHNDELKKIFSKEVHVNAHNDKSYQEWMEEDFELSVDVNKRNSKANSKEVHKK